MLQIICDLENTFAKIPPKRHETPRNVCTISGLLLLIKLANLYRPTTDDLNETKLRQYISILFDCNCFVNFESSEGINITINILYFFLIDRAMLVKIVSAPP